MSSNISLHHTNLDFLPTSKHLPIDAKLQMRISDGASFLFPTLLEHGALIWIPPPRKLSSYLRFLSLIPQHRHLMIHLRNQNSFHSNRFTKTNCCCCSFFPAHVWKGVPTMTTQDLADFCGNGRSQRTSAAAPAALQNPQHR